MTRRHRKIFQRFLHIAKVGDLCCKWLVNQPHVVRWFCKWSHQGVSPSRFLEMKHFVPALCCCHSVKYCFRFCMKTSAGVFCVLYQHRLPILSLQKWWSLYIERKNDTVHRWDPGPSLLILKCVYRRKGMFVAPLFSLHKPHHSG